jgi:hypothetical protein
MYNVASRKRMSATSSISIVLYIFAIWTAASVLSLSDVLAQDKSTSVTCTGLGPCEKTECVDGECETVTTNSSNISTPIESDVKGLDKDESVTDKDSDTHKSIADLLRDRLSMQEDRE